MHTRTQLLFVLGVLGGAVGCGSDDASGSSSSAAGPTSAGAGGSGATSSGTGAGGTGAGTGAGTPARALRPVDVKRLNRAWRRATRARLALLLDSVSQPFNVGSIFRTAAALGAEQIWLCGDSASPEQPLLRQNGVS